MAAEWHQQGEGPARRILILGGGFAGVNAAYQLLRQLEGEAVEVSIVNRENFFVFYPLLPEIISGAVEVEDVLSPIRLVVPGASLYVGEVTGIDLAARRVDILHGLYGHDQQPRSLYYDHLVLALGGVPATARIPGLAEHAFDLQRIGSAFALRNHLIDTLEQADIELNPVVKRELLTFVVVGGGTNGVEVAAEMHDLLSDATRYYPHVEPDEIKSIIVHSGERLFPELPEQLARFADELLTRRGIEIKYRRRVTAVEPQRVHLDDGEVLEAATIVGSVGVDVNPLTRNLPISHDPRGRITVLQTLQVDEQHPNVWAIGDDALVMDPNTGQPYPQTAQHAVREAKLVARNIAASLRGEPLESMNYRTLGQLVSLGHQSAIANIRGHNLSGFPAWWLWRSYYLMQLPRWDKRLRVVFDWTLDLIFPPELVQLKVGQQTPRGRGNGYGGGVTVRTGEGQPAAEPRPGGR